MDFIGGGRDERQQTKSSLLCSENVVTAVCVRQCAGLMYAGGRWCCSPWISYICPAGARPKPRPSYADSYTTAATTLHCGTVRCQRALWRGAIGCGGISQCISCTITPHRRCLHQPSRKPRIFFHILTTLCCRSLCLPRASEASWTHPTSPHG